MTSIGKHNFQSQSLAYQSWEWLQMSPSPISSLGYTGTFSLIWEDEVSVLPTQRTALLTVCLKKKEKKQRIPQVQCSLAMMQPALCTEFIWAYWVMLVGLRDRENHCKYAEAHALPVPSVIKSCVSDSGVSCRQPALRKQQQAND